MLRYIIPLFMLIGCGKPIVDKTKEQKESNNPVLSGVSEKVLMDIDMSYNFYFLPLKGTIADKEKLWSGDSWRLNRGAINYRWNAENKVGFDYQAPSSREVLASPTKRLEELSPAEKYDILMGRYDYPLKYEVDWMARNGKMDWEGLCHGWAGASLNHKEPGPVTLTNPDGIKVPFGSSDVKALLTYAYSKLIVNSDAALGKRCEFYSLVEEDYCDNDLSPVTFHAVVTNKIGLRGQSFIADMDRYKEVWNHPILSYETKILTKRNRYVTVTTKLVYVDIFEKNSWEKGLKQMRSNFTTKYELELDKNGNMIGGRWLSYERPDFLWTVTEPLEFEGYLQGVKKLLK